MTLAELKRHIARFEKQGLRPDSLILVYSDKYEHADMDVGLAFVEGEQTGMFALVMAPSTSRDSIEESAIIDGDAPPPAPTPN